MTEPVAVPLDERALALRAKREVPVVLGLRYLRAGISGAVALLQERNRSRRDNGEAPLLYQFAYWLWGEDASKASRDLCDGRSTPILDGVIYHGGMSTLTLVALALLPVRVAYVVVDRTALRPLGWCLRRAWYGPEDPSGGRQ